MADVIEFPRRAVVDQLDPPAQARETVPIPDGAVWQCGRCSNQLFYITPSGYVCSDCGRFRGMD